MISFTMYCITAFIALFIGNKIYNNYYQTSKVTALKINNPEIATYEAYNKFGDSLKEESDKCVLELKEFLHNSKNYPHTSIEFSKDGKIIESVNFHHVYQDENILVDIPKDINQ